MGDSITVLLVTALFIIITLNIVSTAFYNVLNFEVQAKKHSRISASKKENVQTGASLSNITTGGDNSFVATNTTQGSSISHSISNLKSAEKLANQAKHFVQSKLRQVLAETIPHQYIVVLKNGVTESAQSIAQQAVSRGGIVPFVYNNAIKGFAIKIANKLVLNSILSNPSVDFVEPDIKVQAFSQGVSTGYSRVGGPLSSINGSHPRAVNAGIAIIDTGIDFTHPELNVYKQVSFVPGTSTANDDNGHGTAVAGIVAAEGNVGAIGIAPGARLWAIKVLDKSGTGSMSSIIEGIDYVTQNAGQIDAANLSFGCKCNSSALDTAINNSVARWCDICGCSRKCRGGFVIMVSC